MAKIEKVATGSQVKVLRNGAVVKLKEGDALESGDEVNTDANTAVDLRLEDETLLRVGVNSSYKIQSDSGLHALVHRLVSGAVRVLVKPTEGDKKEMAAIKFRLNTPEGTIGVRGTEFVVLEKGGKTEVKGLDGDVLFGPSGADFAEAGKFIHVTRGFSSTIAKDAKSASPAQKFNLKEYLNEIGGKQGMFGPLAARVSGSNRYARSAAPQAVSAAGAPAAPAPAPKVAAKAPEKAAAKAPAVDPQRRLFLAAQNGDVKAAEEALKAGARVNEKNALSEGHTALQIGMLNDRGDIFVFLIKHGADVDALDERGQTPLMFVAKNALDMQFARALVYPGGANMELKDPKGQTALDLARASGYSELVDYLTSKEADDDAARAKKERK